MEMDNVKKRLAIGLLKQILRNFPSFSKGNFKVIASSANGPAYSLEKFLYNKSDQQYDDPIFPDMEFNDLARHFFIEMNKEKKCNVLVINYEGNDFNFNEYWDQSAQDDFDKYLPDDMKGNVIPWYMQGSDYIKNGEHLITVSAPTVKKWSPIGTLLEEFELGYLNPLHHHYPQWAGDRFLQLWHTHWDTYFICTQGLHDEKETQYSLGLELYLETVEKPEPFDSSWQANIVYSLGGLLPKVADLQQRFETYKYLSIQIEMEGAPEDWSLPESDNIGVLLGIEHEEFEKRGLQFNFTPLNCKLLRPAETKMIKKLNVQGRTKLVNFFKQKGTATITSLTRPSAVRDE